MTEPITRTVHAPGATLSYDIRGEVHRGGSTSAPVLFLIGSPMGSAAFAGLAAHFTDRTVVTYDPRGTGRSLRTDSARRTEVAEHADDLHRIITDIGPAAVDIFASSGGAVNALDLVARHPGQVHVLVAHEPPALRELPDSKYALAAAEDMRETYVHRGFGPAMAKFIAFVMEQGEITAEYAQRPEPSPAAFGLPADDDGSRDDALLGLNMPSCVEYRHDFDAIRAAMDRGQTRVVIGIGEQSARQVPGRAAAAVAARLGAGPVMFPGDHGGFTSGEQGGSGDPAAFAVTLRSVLG